jgi:hypothetical protein
MAPFAPQICLPEKSVSQTAEMVTVRGIEPGSKAYETFALPLSYTALRSTTLPQWNYGVKDASALADRGWRR